MLVPAARKASLRRHLLAWYDRGHRDLPWRFPQHSADPYRVWLAEVMLQQTQVRAVIPYYQRFLARFPTLEALAAAAEEDVVPLWSGLGYYARCRNLLAAAREAASRHGGLPASLEALRALPGFGPYTAGAVASIAFAIPAPAVDGNVVRVLSRLFAVDGAPASAAFRERIGALAAALVPAERPGDFNQALMELGATVCGKAAPACDRCPVAAPCAARATGRERELPAARRRAAQRPLALACAVVRRGEDVLLVRRRAEGLFGGQWALPCVEVAPGASAREALAAGLAPTLGAVTVGEELAAVTRVLTHRRLTLRAFACRAGRAAAGAGRLVPLREAGIAGIPAAMRSVLDAIAASA